MPHHPGAVYLLNDGRTVRSSRPMCYYHRSGHVATGALPQLPDRDDGIWAEVPAADPTDALRWRVVAWLCPRGEAVLWADRALHRFRDAVCAQHDDARFVRYTTRVGGPGAIAVAIGDDE